MAVPDHRRAWITVARVGVVFSAVLIAVVAITACIWRPDQMAALTLVPPWCWLVAGVASAFVVWRVRQVRLALALAAFWLAFAAGWVEEVPALARLGTTRLPWTGAPKGPLLRVVSLNCAGSERCVQDLLPMGADVVLLQEAPGREALERMKSELFGERGAFIAGGDVAILARGKFSREWMDSAGTFVVARVHLTDGRQVTCISLRLAPPPARLDPWNGAFWDEHRKLRQQHRRQLGQVMRAVVAKSDESAVVVGGDFNTVPLDPALGQLRPRLTDTFAGRGVGFGGTGTNDWPLFRVDQIWTSARLAPIHTVARKTAHSDHRMVIGEMLIAP